MWSRDPSCKGPIASICLRTLSVPRSEQFSVRSRKIVRFSEQIMSADNYPGIFSRQMEAIVYIYYDGKANENSLTH